MLIVNFGKILDEPLIGKPSSTPVRDNLASSMVRAGILIRLIEERRPILNVGDIIRWLESWVA